MTIKERKKRVTANTALPTLKRFGICNAKGMLPTLERFWRIDASADTARVPTNISKHRLKSNMVAVPFVPSLLPKRLVSTTTTRLNSGAEHSAKDATLL